MPTYNQDYEVLACLPKLPLCANDHEIAEDVALATRDLEFRRTGVKPAIDRLKREGYRIDSWPTHTGMRYGLSVVSWDRAHKACNAYYARIENTD